MFDLKDNHNVLHKKLSAPRTSEVSSSMSSSKETSYPPPYTVDPPNVTAGFSNLTLHNRMSAKPSGDQCIAHLKLLECFHELRETIATTDGLYGVKDEFVPSGLNERMHASVLTKIREKRWSIYVAQAAKRFELWWEHCVEPNSLKDPSRDSVTRPILWEEKVVPEFSKSNLPPIGASHQECTKEC